MFACWFGFRLVYWGGFFCFCFLVVWLDFCCCYCLGLFWLVFVCLFCSVWFVVFCWGSWDTFAGPRGTEWLCSPGAGGRGHKCLGKVAAVAGAAARAAGRAEQGPGRAGRAGRPHRQSRALRGSPLPPTNTSTHITCEPTSVSANCLTFAIFSHARDINTSFLHLDLLQK